MTTIDKLDFSVYNRYAIFTSMIEDITRQFHLEEASTIPPQTLLVDVVPKLTELELLFGIVRSPPPWAFFFPPKELRSIRRKRSPFAFHRIITSLENEEEKLQEKLASISCHTPEEENEKVAISSCLAQIEKINQWMSFIVGRVGQFLQG